MGRELFVPPNMSSVKVIVNGQTNNVTGVDSNGVRSMRRLLAWDLRIGNQLYLQLSSRISDGASVRVINDGTLWPYKHGVRCDG